MNRVSDRSRPRNAQQADPWPWRDDTSRGWQPRGAGIGSWRPARWATDGAHHRYRTLSRLVRLFCASMALGLLLGALRGAHQVVRPTGDTVALRARLAVLQRSASAIALLRLLDSLRARAGRAALRFDARLGAIARARSQDMIARHYFAHHIRGVGTVFTIMDRLGISYALAGENLATNNYALFVTPANVLRLTERDFVDSREHRGTMLDPGFSRVGIGVAGDARTGQIVVSEVFAGP